MRIPPVPHAWRVSPRRAVHIQRGLAERVICRPPRRAIRFVAGVDAAFSKDYTRCIAGAVLWDLRARKVIEQRIGSRPLVFPYIPGLLSFREAPAILAALRKLRHTPDALLCDGQGLAHPRRLGIACHIGVLTDLPSVGCAKSRLTGTFTMPKAIRGDRAPLLDGTERIGTVLRTRDGVKPLFISIGHRMNLPAAERLVLDCGAGYRLPEPTRLADQLVARAKREDTLSLE